jgi:glutamate transport system substrate-binding protein
VTTDQLILVRFANADKQNRLFVVPDLHFGHEERYGIGFPHGQTAECNVLRDAGHRFIANGKWNDFFRKNLEGIGSERSRARPQPGQPCP